MGNMCAQNHDYLTRDTPSKEVKENETHEVQQFDIQLQDEIQRVKLLDPSWSREKRFQELAPEGSVLLDTKPIIKSPLASQIKKQINRNIIANEILHDTLSLDALELPSGDVCKGNWGKDRKMYKKAKIYLENGGYFVGQMNQSEPVSGLLIYSNGDYYQGGFKGFQANGKGTFVSKDGYKYEGQWENDKMHQLELVEGKPASYQKENEFSYTGYFKNGQKSDQGTLEVNNVFKYVGKFQNDQIHGEGKLNFLDGSDRSYEGSFKNNKKEGKGTFLWPKLKAEYKGTYEDDLKHGHGKMKFWNGAIYEGEFQYDKIHGKGQLTLPGETESIEVRFEQGRFIKTIQSSNSNEKIDLNQDELFQLELDDYEEALPQIF